MDANTLNQTEAWIIALLFFILMLISSFVGKLFRNYIRTTKHTKEKSTETSNNEYDSRRKIIIEETNDIGTAITSLVFWGRKKKFLKGSTY
ncbi:hypothetical protein [Flavobacterium pectinovorum]|uniref:Uncharacterized protein n=1 Tax=Flavobacterium pectinovorum TaxID=29533 RepID=A0A502E1G5_9FLAO|nr:hypothetical protein [Flavobacterium pectinovorum]TPG31628.1 hypothetical protein EAH81_26700 [Flavobacterium pectinovorum]